MENNKPSGLSTVYFNYRHCIELGRKSIQSNQHSYGDFFLYVALLCPSIDIQSYLEAVSLRSYVYYKLKDSRMLLMLSLKTLKRFQAIMAMDNKKTLSDVVKTLNRAGLVISEDKQLHSVIAFYLMSKGKQIIDLNQSCQLNESDRLLFDQTYESVRKSSWKALFINRSPFEAVIDAETGLFLLDKRNELYQILEEHMDRIDIDLKGDEVKPGEECYLISNKWLQKYTKYLDKLLSIKDSPQEYISYISKAFEVDRQLSNFAEEEGKDDEDVYIDSVNNFWLIKLKEHWCDLEGHYANDYVNPHLSKEKYSIVSKEHWEEIVKDYDFINAIKRFKLSSGEIEVNLKEIRVMLLDRAIFAKHPSLIYPRRMQLSKEGDSYDTIIERVYAILNQKRPESFNMYQLDLNALERERRNQFLIELMLAYSMDDNSRVHLIGKQIGDLKRTIEAIQTRTLIVIEAIDISKPSRAFIQLKSSLNQCSLCESPRILQACTLCEANQIKEHYCSLKCQKADINHQQFHRFLSHFISIRFSLQKIRSIPIIDIIKHRDALNGLVGLKNLGNTCFLSSALQCLSHCEDLTKYFLLKQYKLDINSSLDHGTAGQIAKAYYRLMKQLWRGAEPLAYPTEFRAIFNHFVQQFDDNSQHDSQEALSFILDKIHEDLNKIYKKPYIEMNNHTSTASDKEASDKWWRNYKRREQSIIVDLFHGQFKNKITCSHCKHVSIIFDPFVFISLPIPSQSYLIQFKFFPLLKANYARSNRKKKAKKGRKLSATPQLLSYQSFELTVTDAIRVKDFVKPILKANPDLNEKELCLFDFVLLKPSKEFHKQLTTPQQLSDSIDELVNGYEMCVYEKQDDVANVFVYPCDFVSISKWYFIPDIRVDYLAYPLAIPMMEDECVKELYAKINTSLKPIVIQGKNKQVNEEESHYSSSYKLFIYNTKRATRQWYSPSYWYNYLTDIEFEDKASLCDFCGSSQCHYCSFLNKFGQNESFKTIYSYCSGNTPLILYAQIFLYDKSQGIYANAPLPLFISQSLSIAQSKVMTIYDCFDLFTAEEYLDGDNKWYCSKCKAHQEATKKLDMYTLPPYLIIQLKRFKSRSGFSFSYGRKNFAFIDFPLEALDLSRYIHNQSEVDTKYDLIAISEHYGQLSSGHYVAKCKNGDQWYEFDDNSVTRKSKEDIGKGAAYLLFYKKK